MWLAARADLAGTPVAHYLAARGIDLAELTRQPGALRCHFDLFNRESGRSWPAMVAAIVGPDGRHAATHCLWLAEDAGGISRKAPLRDQKMTLGSYAGGYIPLTRGASGKPLAHAPDGETVAIGEGIETCLSVAIASPELRVLAVLSLANMARLVLPEAVRSRDSQVRRRRHRRTARRPISRPASRCGPRGCSGRTRTRRQHGSVAPS